ncbi:hypothetical protein [Amycolatopsis sp. NPDC051372]|uniref:hypothetical protein n=1 Tax=unclassified Amycolatopsis TaxID=2618356 RepID=UPI003426F7CB
MFTAGAVMAVIGTAFAQFSKVTMPWWSSRRGDCWGPRSCSITPTTEQIKAVAGAITAWGRAHPEPPASVSLLRTLLVDRVDEQDC